MPAKADTRGAKAHAARRGGEKAKAKTKPARRPKQSRFRLGASRAPTPANAGNVGLGGKTGVTTPREKPGKRKQ